MTRTFIAILLPDAWTIYLRDHLRQLSEKVAGLSWVRPENMHVTVRFLGDLTDEDVAGVRDSVRRAAASLHAPVARLGGLGTFHNPRRATVLWVGFLRGEEEMKALAGAIDEDLARDGFGRADKPFRAHVTVARPRSGVGFEPLLDRPFDNPPPEEPLRRLAVMKSDLHPSGARYTVLEELRLLEPAH